MCRVWLRDARIVALRHFILIACRPLRIVIYSIIRKFICSFLESCRSSPRHKILSQNRTRQADCARTNRITRTEGGYPPGTSRHASKQWIVAKRWKWSILLGFRVICTEHVQQTTQCLRSTERRQALWTSSSQSSAASGSDGQAKDPTKYSDGVQ